MSSITNTTISSFDLPIEITDAFWFWFIFWLIFMAAGAILILFYVYSIVSLGDLESDYLNPVDLCEKLNKFANTEIIGHVILTLLLLFFGSWYEFLLNLPVAIFNVKSILFKEHLIDPTTIFTHLNYHKKKSIIKLVIFMMAFFIYLYQFIHLCVQTLLNSHLTKSMATSILA